MSESEFDAYLSLVGKLLRLSPRQRSQIADELRDHLEERFQHLVDQGTPRDEALRLAVDELGDAAALARQFTLPYHIRRRRQLMRYSVTSAVVIVTTFVMAAFYWPANRPEPSMHVQAQAPAAGTPPLAPVAVDAGVPLRALSAARADVMSKLENRGFELSFNEVPLQDVISFLSDAGGVDILLDHRYLGELGLDTSTPVNLTARKGALSIRTAIELILEQVGGNDLACAVRDGVILISAADNSYENRVYNCRDLLENVQVHQAGGGGAIPGMAQMQIAPEAVVAMLAAAATSQMGGAPGGMQGMGGGGYGGMGGGGIGYPQPATTSAAGAKLIQVILSATSPASWVSQEGTGGTISEYDGLLIIRHQQKVHQKIEELLDQIRQVRGEAKPAAPAAALDQRANKDPSMNISFAEAPIMTIAARIHLQGQSAKSVLPGTLVKFQIPNDGNAFDARTAIAQIVRVESLEADILQVVIKGYEMDLQKLKFESAGLPYVELKSSIASR